MKKQARTERGHRARLARESAGLSQSDFADLVGCSRQLIGSIEAGGNMNVDQLAAYSVHGRVTTDSIVHGIPELAPPADKLVSDEFSRMSPWLRSKLWPLYQVFVRPALRRDATTSTSPL